MRSNADSKIIKLPLQFDIKAARRSSRLFNVNETSLVVEDVRITNFQKVIKILMNIKNLLTNYNAEEVVLNDLDWVCNTIQSENLYNFEIANEATKLKNLDKRSSDFLGILTNYSDNREEFNIIAKENHLKYSNDEEPFKRSEKSLLKNSIIMNKDEKEKLSQLLNAKKSSSPNLSPLKLNRRRTSTRTDLIGDEFVLNKAEEDQNIDINLGDEDFNIFDFAEKADRRKILPTIYHEVITQLKMKDTHNINTDKLLNFTAYIQAGYNKKILYHNDLHASDLCQTLYCWLLNANIKKRLKLNKLDLLSLYTAAIVHDFKHPGYTNAFHINNVTDLAIQFNDKSVLENMHISEAFKILMKTECNFIENFSMTEFKELRRRMIECVLATDMSHHSKIISQFKTKAEVLGISNGHDVDRLINPDSKTFFEDTQEILNLLIHLADLSHNTKNFDISKKWTYLLYDEFFQQGDHEKSLNASVSMFCDRDSTNIPKAQIGFIKGIMIPSFDVLVDLFPELDYTVFNLEDNLQIWEEMVEEENKMIK
jgi:hypothetical protein